jgi:hypothetical protein
MDGQMLSIDRIFAEGLRLRQVELSVNGCAVNREVEV